MENKKNSKKINISETLSTLSTQFDLSLLYVSSGLLTVFYAILTLI
ncbi:MAG: hypothetical protein WC223_10265 [Bacteroidales bacterium]